MGVRRGRNRMVVGFATTYPISATDVVSSNLDQGEVHNIMCSSGVKHHQATNRHVFNTSSESLDYYAENCMTI